MVNIARWKDARIAVRRTDSADSIRIQCGNVDAIAVGMAAIVVFCWSKIVKTDAIMIKVLLFRYFFQIRTTNNKIFYYEDGLLDCEDPECCSSHDCRTSQLCVSSPKPIDILLRKQPPAITASFFERMKFLIDEGSLQNYARQETFNER